MTYYPPLPEETRIAIRAMKAAHPQMSQMSIAAHFGLSQGSVCRTLRLTAPPSRVGHEPTRRFDERPKPKAAKPHAMPWATPEILMAGNGRLARRSRI